MASLETSRDKTMNNGLISKELAENGTTKSRSQASPPTALGFSYLFGVFHEFHPGIFVNFNRAVTKRINTVTGNRSPSMLACLDLQLLFSKASEQSLSPVHSMRITRQRQ